MSKVEKQQVPKIRFKKFDGEWQIQGINDIATRYSGLTYTPDDVRDSGALVIRSSNIQNDQFVDADNVYVNPDVVNCTYVQKNDVVMVVRNGSRNLIGKHALINKELSNTVIGAFMSAFRTNQGGFLNALLSTSCFHSEVHKSLGATINQITGKNFDLMRFQMPLSIEQTQIGNFFQQLDKLIELQTRAVESAEKYKKAMLQKMFPQKGEKVPRVRFEGFSGDWVTTYFKDVADVRRGLTYSPSDVVTDKKGIRVLRSSNIDEDTLVISDTDVFVSEDAVKISYIKMNEILITAANGSSRLVGKHAIISKDLERAVHGGFMLAVSTSQPEFINSWMNGVQYKKMLQLVQGGNGAIGNLSRSMLEECKITLPCLVEQEKIGNFFQKLDQNIESEKKKLEQYQTMKRAMLQRMFV
ncbi:MAG TPA: restriction endonuclease subunit S [Candidatus Ignatzschineria merdigallinarum]|uniref:Restriction endonuclease subunit S n=1 Tax=Candidatus Ignatzschineria merdigallinarum TaxID=2838621 RepID=A0A9D1Q4H4_9GAMM|nr:restriction endonuclease subunit S [Candidatus Ignatzschineria merdigallinarum]